MLMQALKLWVIYWSPKKFAGMYVMREWIVDGARLLPGRARSAFTLREARTLIPAGAQNLGRCGPDDPVVVETWI